MREHARCDLRAMGGRLAWATGRGFRDPGLRRLNFDVVRKRDRSLDIRPLLIHAAVPRGKLRHQRRVERRDVDDRSAVWPECLDRKHSHDPRIVGVPHGLRDRQRAVCDALERHVPQHDDASVLLPAQDALRELIAAVVIESPGIARRPACEPTDHQEIDADRRSRQLEIQLVIHLVRDQESTVGDRGCRNHLGVRLDLGRVRPAAAFPGIGSGRSLRCRRGPGLGAVRAGEDECSGGEAIWTMHSDWTGGRVKTTED